PTAWFRNTWAWDAGEPKPGLCASAGASVTIEHPITGTMELIGAAGPDGAEPDLLFCDNETNTTRLYGTHPVSPYPKDGINDHVVHGAPTVNPDRAGRTDRRAAAAAAPGRPRRGARRRIGRRLRRGDGPAAGRGGRVLRRADPGRGQHGRGAGAAAGVRGHAVEQAAVLLRRGPLAGRRPHPAGTAGVTQDRAELPVA